mgnify:CR=1 FL=1
MMLATASTQAAEAHRLPALLSITLPRVSRSANVLVVDDEASARFLVSHILRECGCRVFEAANGLEAILTCRAQIAAIDLVITDVVMPHINGWELATRLRKFNPALKVLMMSTYDVLNASVADPVISGDAVQVASGVIRKPICIHELGCKVQEMLDG